MQQSLIASTGSAMLLDKWVEFVRSSMMALNVVNLDLHTPAALNTVWAELRDEHDRVGITGTIYHFGFDPEAGKVVRFTYRSGTGFASERADEPGFGCRPPLEHSKITDHGGDLWAIAEAVRAEQRALPDGEQVFIGGDLYIAHLDKNGITIRHLHRFDDWASDWNAMWTAPRSPTETTVTRAACRYGSGHAVNR